MKLHKHRWRRQTVPGKLVDSIQEMAKDDLEVRFPRRRTLPPAVLRLIIAHTEKLRGRRIRICDACKRVHPNDEIYLG